MPESLSANISQTIGVEYEIVHINNSEHRYNIFQAYNKGAELSHGEYLCFMHEDVMFHSFDWGKIVECQLGNTKVGILGIAGSERVSNLYDWRFGHNRISNLIQGHNTYGEHSIYYINGIEWNINEGYKQVAIVDGCWFCIRTELFKQGKLRFDEDTFNSFHLYDSDISMQVNRLGLDIYICSNIIVEHFSEGLYSEDFLVGLNAFLNKWYAYLPFVTTRQNNVLESSEDVDDAIKSMEMRIQKDKIIREIKYFFVVKDKKEKSIMLSPEAISVIEDSLFQYAKAKIKFSGANSEALKALMLYMHQSYHMRSKSLLWKYIYYRFINKKGQKRIIHVQSLNPQANSI